MREEHLRHHMFDDGRDDCVCGDCQVFADRMSANMVSMYSHATACMERSGGRNINRPIFGPALLIEGAGSPAKASLGKRWTGKRNAVPVRFGALAPQGREGLTTQGWP